MKRSSQQILDEWLVACSQAGDKQAFDRLLQRWRPRLLLYAERQLGDKEAAHDVVQECLLTVSKDLRKLKDVVAFPKWVFQILHRRGCDWIKKQQRTRRNDSELLEDEGNCADKSTEALVNQSLNQLDREHYLTVRFFYLEEFSLHEIALIMDVPLGTVKSRLHSARQRLKNLIGGELYE